MIEECSLWELTENSFAGEAKETRCIVTVLKSDLIEGKSIAFNA